MRNCNTYTKNKPTDNLLNVFLAIVEEMPDKIALVDPTGLQPTYQELNIYADKLATKIYESGIPDNKKIGICIARSFDTIATMLATIKLGCTYIPLATDHPDNRIMDISRKTGLQIVIANNAVLKKLTTINTIIDIDNERDRIKAISNIKFKEDKIQNQPANVIFTSGTTNSPKGVIISQSSVVNLVLRQNYVNITSDDTLLQLSPFEFDGATFEIWGALLNGATLVLMPPGYPILSKIADKIETHGVSLLFITTQLFNLMVDNRITVLDKVKKILFGGEKASTKHVQKFLESRCNNDYLANIYGPTECTTFSTFYPISNFDQLSNDKNIPIGKPIKGCYTLIVDKDLKPVPQNTSGELLIGGKGIADGYLNVSNLTQKKFINKQYDKTSCSYFYRTGDKVFKNDNGDIVFVGRYDKQLKIRGYRVLPGEIEATAMKYPNIASVALTVHENNINDKYLELFITVGNNNFSKNEFKSFLKKELPGYMHVNCITILEKMPLKKNGKIDYVKLKR